MSVLLELFPADLIIDCWFSISTFIYFCSLFLLQRQEEDWWQQKLFRWAMLVLMQELFRFFLTFNGLCSKQSSEFCCECNFWLLDCCSHNVKPPVPTVIRWVIYTWFLLFLVCDFFFLLPQRQEIWLFHCLRSVCSPRALSSAAAWEDTLWSK